MAECRKETHWWNGVTGTLWAALLVLLASPAQAQNRNKVDGNVNEFNGSMSQTLPIEVPDFYDIEPGLSLSYSSSAGNGVVGVGWRLNGFSTLERVSSRKGAPTYTSSDRYLLDGEEVVACGTGNTSVSCTTGGTHYTKKENFSRIKYASSTDTWTVEEPNGDERTFGAIYTTTSGTARYGITQEKDTNNNTVTYAWSVNQFGCCWAYPSTVTYNGVTVQMYWETRNDVEWSSIGIGWEKNLGRLHSIDIKRGTSRIRTYDLTYTYSAATNRSILSSVKQYGKDATVDTAGVVTNAGTASSFPATSFTMQGSTNDFTNRWAASGIAAKMRLGGTTKNYQLLDGDFNGDGLDDVAAISIDAGDTWNANVFLELSTPTGKTSATWAASLPTHIRNGVNTNTFFIMPGDFNGDGMTDIAAVSPNATGGWATTIYVELSTGSGFTSQAWTTTLPDHMRVGGSSSNYQVFPGDLNGDGKTDLFAVSPNAAGGWSGTIFVELSQGNDFWSYGWGATLPGDLRTGGSGADYRYFPGDFNGDGLTDLMVYSPNAAGGWSGSAYGALSTGSAFTSISPATSAPTKMRAGSGRYWGLAGDFNADGKTDVAWVSPDASHSEWNTKLWVDISSGLTGSSPYFETQGRTAGLPGHMRNGGTTMDYQVRPGDLNADGKTDLVVVSRNATGAWTTNTFVELAYTSTAFDSESWDTANLPEHMRNGVSTSNYLVTVGDYNGDGRTDLYAVSPNASGGWATNDSYDIASGTYPDLMTQVTFPSGGTASYAYSFSSLWPSPHASPVMPVVASITSNDGRGNTATTTYSYSGAKYDYAEREFLGFNLVTEELPCISGETSPNCPYIEYVFDQPNNCQAQTQPVEIRHKSGTGALLTRTVNEYTLTCTAPAKALLTGTWEYTYDKANSATYVRSYESYAYDTYGNVTSNIEYGNYDATGDEKRTLTTYYPNTTAFITDAEAKEEVWSGTSAGSLLTQTTNYYDCNPVTGSPACSATAQPSKANLAKVEERLDRLSYTDTTVTYVVTDKKLYDSYGNVTEDYDELGNKTTYTYHATYPNLQLSSTNPLSQAVSQTWDVLCGGAATQTDVNSQVTTATFDNLCRVSRVDYPNGNFVITSYVNTGTPTTQYVEIALPPPSGITGNVYTRTYLDGLGRVYKTEKRAPTANILTETTFDARGNVRTQKKPYLSGASTTYTVTTDYDALNRVTKVTDNADSTFVSTTYGPTASCTGTACVFAVSVSNELGKVTRELSNVDGNVTRSDEYQGASYSSATYAYDLLGRRTSITDPAGNAVTFTYDSMDRVVRHVDLNVGTIDYTYDAAGRLLTQTIGVGTAISKLTTNSYDSIGRRTQKVTAADNKTFSWTYDQVRTGFYNKGRLTTMTDPLGSHTFDYDPAGNLDKEVRTTDAVAYTLTYDYDTAGRRTSTTYPDGDTVGTSASPVTYDEAGRLKTIPGLVTTATYDASGRLTSLTSGNGVVSTWTYNSADELTRIQHVKGTTNLVDLTYAFDDASRITGITSASTSSANEGWTYAYDDVGRLTSALNTGSAANDQLYTYAANGNILTSKLGTAAAQTYTYPAAGAARPHAVTSVGGTSYVYNEIGQMTSRGGVALTFNGDGLLSGRGSDTFAYDADRVRIKQVVGGVTTRFLGDDLEVDVASGKQTKHISLDGILIAKLERTGSTTTTSYLHVDLANSVRVVTNSTGTEVLRKKYRPFGDLLAKSGTGTDARGFDGQRQLSDTAGDLIYLHERYYDPVIARFISPDPILPEAAGIAALNRYAFAANDGVNKNDNSGMAPMYKMKRGVVSTRRVSRWRRNHRGGRVHRRKLGRSSIAKRHKVGRRVNRSRAASRRSSRSDGGRIGGGSWNQSDQLHQGIFDTSSLDPRYQNRAPRHRTYAEYRRDGGDMTTLKVAVSVVTLFTPVKPVWLMAGMGANAGVGALEGASGSEQARSAAVSGALGATRLGLVGAAGRSARLAAVAEAAEAGGSLSTIRAAGDAAAAAGQARMMSYTGWSLGRNWRSAPAGTLRNRLGNAGIAPGSSYVGSALTANSLGHEIADDIGYYY